MIDEEKVLDALTRRDFAYLTDLVRDDAALEPEARELLAEIFLNILSGKWKRSARRPQSLTAEQRRFDIAKRVAELETVGWPAEAAVAQVASEFDCTPRWVWKMQSEHRKITVIADRLRASTGELVRRAPDRMLALGRRFRIMLAKAIYER
jgi:hypothetical protein